MPSMWAPSCTFTRSPAFSAVLSVTAMGEKLFKQLLIDTEVGTAMPLASFSPGNTWPSAVTIALSPNSHIWNTLAPGIDTATSWDIATLHTAAAWSYLANTTGSLKETSKSEEAAISHQNQQ